MSERPDVFSSSTPTARKRHHCCECRAPIEPGEQYVRSQGLWDGHWDTFVQCQPCADLMERAASAVQRWDDVPAFTDLLTYLLTYLRERELFGGIADPDVFAAEARFAAHYNADANHNIRLAQYQHPGDPITPDLWRRMAHRLRHLESWTDRLEKFIANGEDFHV